MNETNVTPRQKRVLNLVNQASGLSRGEIQKQTAKWFPLSKPTLIRDLNRLIKEGFIKTEGKGKSTKYFPFFKNSLLRVFGLEQYFLQEPDKRIGAKKKFDFGVFRHLNNLFTPAELEELEGCQKSFNSQTKELGQDVLKRELERFVIELSWKSSKIEGNTYTLLETEALIKGKREAKGRTRGEAVMILNHKEAFEEILKDRNQFKKLKLSQINQLHNLMVKNLDISPGIRKRAVGITGTVYRPLDNQFQLEEAMEKFVEAVNKNRQPLEKALIVKAMLSYIQPYVDGNKRTGRMLANAVLLAHDYYPLSYRSVDEEEFKKALILFYEQGSIYHLKRLFLEQLIFAYQNYFV